MYSLAPTNNSANLPFEFWFSTLLYDQPYSDSRIIYSYQWQMIRSSWHEHVSCWYASCTKRAHDPWGGIGMVWYHIYYITSLRTVRDHDYWLAWWPTFCRWKAAFVTFTGSKELLGTMLTRSMMSTHCRWKAAYVTYGSVARSAPGVDVRYSVSHDWPITYYASVRVIYKNYWLPYKYTLHLPIMFYPFETTFNIFH